ncbi:MAG: ABC transporter permease [Gemmatimonadaceae bacterium]
MASAGRVGRHLKSLIWRETIAEQVDAELDFHIEMLTRELMARGMTREAARGEAVRRFGDVNAVNATCRSIGTEREREMQRTEFFAELRQDIAYAVRHLIKSPGFTLVAILTLALGIGATTAIFSAVRSVVLRSFPWAEPERVMAVMERWNDRDGNVSAGNFVDWREASTSFSALAAEQFSSFNIAEGDQAERVSGGRVTQDFFAVYGARPLLGRFFLPEEDQPGREHVAVLSEGMWRRRFAGERGILGRVLRLSGREYQVVGVAPASFDPTASAEELWVPAAFTPERRAQHDEHYLFVTGLLKPGVARERAQSEMDGIMRGLAERYPKDDRGRGVRVAWLPEILIGDLRQRLFIMLGAVTFVLLIACGNVANLLLARGAARQKEIAIRAALGAGRGRIMRQLLTESAVLALVAAAIGLGLAHAGIKLLVANAPEGIPRLEQTRIDGVVLAFAVAAALASSLIFGLAPALRAARQNLQGTLKEGGRGMGTARDRIRSSLIVAEVALALTLLVGAGLLIRSALYLQSVRPGFDPSGILTARLALPQAEFKDPPQVIRAFKDVVERLQAAPGVRAAAVVSQAPMGPGGGSNGLVPEGKVPDPANIILARLRMVTPGYLATMKIPLKRGRGFTDRDIAGAERVMIVSEALAKAAWPGQDPIGKRIGCCEGGPTDPRYKTVIGVVGDVRSGGPTVEVGPEFYMPIEQMPPEAWDWVQRTMTLVARGATPDAASLTGAMRAAVREVGPQLPLYSVATMDESIRNSTAQARFNTILLTTLGVIGLLLAAVGIYSVIAYFVSQRSHEIGVRMALGAQSKDVVMLMTWQGLRPVFIGVALGAAGAFAAARLLRTSLYGVTETDPTTFAVVVAVLVAVALVATLIPARRATRVDPTAALQAA